MWERTTKRPPLTPEQVALVQDHWEEAEKVAGAYMKKTGYRDHDFMGAVAIVVCECAQDYQPDRGTTFKTYLQMRCDGACKDVLRKSALCGYRRRKEEPPQVQSLGTALLNEWGKSGKATVADIVARALTDPCEPVEAATEAADEVIGMTRILSRVEREVIQRMYLEASTPTMKTVGEHIGLSESRVCQLHTQALRYLRERLSA